MKAINKDIIREIKKTKSKFISLIIIIFLGVFVFVGLKETSPTMLNTTNAYFKNINMYDLKIKNNFLLTKDDITTITSFENIDQYESYYEISTKENQYNYNIELKSLPLNIAKPKLIKGNLPNNDNEIVLTESLINKFNIGDKITFSTSSEKITLKNSEYTISGFVYGVDYPENSTNNPINANYFAYISKTNFESEFVSGINIILKNINRENYTSEGYYSSVNSDRDKLITILEKQQEKNNIKFQEDNAISYEKSKSTLEEYKTELSNSENNIERLKTIDEARYKLLKEELEKNKEQLETQEEELLAGKESLDNTNYPKFKVENIKGNAQYKQFIASSESLISIANIFSIFLFSVALLVSLTTITRMIDENRTNIGTLKSLGYSNIKIYKKYYVYSLTASIIGATLGVIGAYKVVIPIIYNAYARLLTLKIPIILPDIKIIILAFFISILCVIFAVYIPIGKLLKEKSSYLLRPKSPKTAKRILLEYIPFIWKKLSFLRKVTFRNIFRYKVRMIMTIFGVLGCLALMFIGFGIRFGVMNISNEQFKVISKFDIIATYNPYIINEEKEKLHNQIKNDKNIEQFTQIHIANATIEKNNEVLDIVPLISIEKDKVKDYITLKNEKEIINLDDSGAVINEKLAYLHNLKIGDMLKLTVNEKEYNLKITNINNNYFGHTVYISNKYYEKIFEKEYSYNSFLIKAYNNEENVNNIIDELDKNKNILFVQNNLSFQNALDSFIDGIDIIVVVLVLCSLSLALVVLYNLININISERIRELSTIKVLGFYAKEVTSYVFREIFYLAIIGVIIGNFIGYILYKKIILDLAAREMMFNSKPSLLVYIISSSITFLIIILVMVIIHIRLKKVNMVESLKAIE